MECVHANANAMQRVERLLLTNLRLLQVEGVSGIQQSGGRRTAGEVAVVRVLQLPAEPNKKLENNTTRKMTLPLLRTETVKTSNVQCMRVEGGREERRGGRRT